MSLDPEEIAKYVDENLYEGHSGFTVPPPKKVISEGITENLGIIIHKDHPDRVTIYNMNNNKKFVVLQLARPITPEQIELLTDIPIDNYPTSEPSIDPEPTIIGGDEGRKLYAAAQLRKPKMTAGIQPVVA